MERKWVLYILECGDGTLYTGITDDLEKRFKAHSSGKGAKYTRGRGPLRLRYQEICEDHSAALRREHAVKKMSRLEKMALMDSCRGNGPSTEVDLQSLTQSGILNKTQQKNISIIEEDHNEYGTNSGCDGSRYGKPLCRRD